MNKTSFDQADLASVSDNPELTEADFAQMKPFGEVFPELAAKLRRARGPQKSPTKVSTTIRLSPEVVAYFKSQGTGWQSRIDHALKEWVAGQA